MKKTIALLVITLLMATGCTSKYGNQLTDVNYYPSCYDPIGELRASEERVQTGAGAGMAVGAVLGALIGYAVTGKARGALVGAAAGTAVGGVAGYGIAKHRENINAEERMAAYNTEMNSDMSKMDIVTLSATRARQCYENAFEQARADLKAKRITTAEFDSRYQEIRSGLVESSSILGDLSTNMASRDKEYNEALAYEAEQKNMPVPNPEVYTLANQSNEPVKAKSKTKSKPKAGPKPQARASEDPELDQLARQNAEFKNKQTALDAERAATDNAIAVFDQNAQDLMGIGA